MISTIFRALLTTIRSSKPIPPFSIPFSRFRDSWLVCISSPVKTENGGLPLQIQSSEVILRLKTAQFLTNIHVKAIHCTARKWRNSAVFANQAGSRQIVERLQGECGFRIENGRHKKGASDCQFTCALSDRVFGSVNLPGSTVEMGQKMLFMSGLPCTARRTGKKIAYVTAMFLRPCSFVCEIRSELQKEQREKPVSGRTKALFCCCRSANQRWRCLLFPNAHRWWSPS